MSDFSEYLRNRLGPYDEITGLRYWRRASTGSLVRRYQHYKLTIFRRGDEYGWCIDIDGEPQYSPETYESEEDALNGLAHELVI